MILRGLLPSFKRSLEKEISAKVQGYLKGAAKGEIQSGVIDEASSTSSGVKRGFINAFYFYVFNLSLYIEP